MKFRLLSLLTCCFSFFISFTCIASEGVKVDQLMVGYGQSFPGFGETTETLNTAEIIMRWERLFEEYDPQRAKFGARSHQFWVELGASALIHDTDKQDSKDYGVVSLSFLSAWAFKWSGQLEPYIFVGGGPVYVFADIEGVGSDICGNYQVGVGLKGLSFFNQPGEVQIKYRHMSNLNMAKPNVAINAFCILISLPF